MENNNSKTYLKIWFFFFLYTLVVSLLIQFFLIHFVPSSWMASAWAKTNGMFFPDCSTFHSLAKILSEKILQQGWSAWELRPNGQGPAGIAAIIYAITTPEPWTLLPLNAILHATSGLLLLVIVQKFVSDWRYALVCVLPYVFYPTAASWYAQIHKDSYSVAGIIMILYGWIHFVGEEERLQKATLSLWYAFLIILGSFLIWTVRPYLNQQIAPVSLLISFVISYKIIFLNKSMSVVSGKFVTLLGVWLSLFVIIGFGSTSPLVGRSSLAMQKAELSQGSGDAKDLSKTRPVLKQVLAHIESKISSSLKTIYWFRYIWIKSNLGKGDESRSHIDTEIQITSFKELVSYVPRALQIALFAPFPYHWFGEGSIPENSLLRRISGVEMIGIYFSLFFMPYAIWHWRKKFELWIVILFSLSMLAIQGVIMVNIGTLHRMRYGFLMPLVVLGVAGGIEVYKKLCSSLVDNNNQV